MRTLNEDLLQRFCSHFFGYGTRDARWVFLGMEEAGCRDQAEAKARLNAWHNLNEGSLIQLSQFVNSLYELTAQPQPTALKNKTWEFLIRIRLAAEGSTKPSKESLFAFLRERLGDSSGETSLLEFMPLPCQGIKAWPWPQWCNVQRRKPSYVKQLAQLRIEKLQEIVGAKGNPRVVVFYGGAYAKYWLPIAGLDKMQVIPDFRPRAQWAGRDGKLFVSVFHPSYIRWCGVDPNTYATHLGVRIGSQYNGT